MVVGTNSRGSTDKTKVCESCGTVGNSDPLPHSVGTGRLHVGYQQNRRSGRAAKPIILVGDQYVCVWWVGGVELWWDQKSPSSKCFQAVVFVCLLIQSAKGEFTSKIFLMSERDTTDHSCCFTVPWEVCQGWIGRKGVVAKGMQDWRQRKSVGGKWEMSMNHKVGELTSSSSCKTNKNKYDFN